MATVGENKGMRIRWGINLPGPFFLTGGGSGRRRPVLRAFVVVGLLMLAAFATGQYNGWW
jgi:hypothetical protein